MNRARRGFSLVEMMISLVVLSVIMGAAISVLRSQSQSFLRGGARMDLNQNARFALTTVDRVLRTLGAGTTPDQPMLVYADGNTIVFNTNYASDSTDGTAVYLNPDLPAGAVNSITTGSPLTIPGTAITYPSRNYSWVSGEVSRAETVLLFVRPDSSTADPVDLVLFQQVNATAPELIARGLRPYPGRPFFEFWFDSTPPSGATVSRQLASTRLPVRHTSSAHGSPGDIGASALADSISLVRVNFVATNGLVLADTATRAFSSMVQLPNNGLQASTRTCGDPPSAPLTFNASSSATGRIDVGWGPSGDDGAGERDVMGYTLYYRLTSQPGWTVWLSQSGGHGGYSLMGGGFIPGANYVVGITAHDCTPKQSTMLTATVHVQP
jgi:prepilin-type N-terminal cleavage/methylation domain-containing protein